MKIGNIDLMIDGENFFLWGCGLCRLLLGIFQK